MTRNTAALAFLSIDKTEGAKTHLSSDKVHLLLQKIHTLMAGQRPFLRERYTLEDFARDVDLQPYQLSAFLNTVMAQNFHTLINGYRIRHCVELLQAGGNRRIRVKQMAQLCGFRNRNSFITAFKRHTNRNYANFFSAFLLIVCQHL